MAISTYLKVISSLPMLLYFLIEACILLIHF
uniref:Uncharacterized protein n=1 Tax=Arundo donax TaxID=35708 RepID=A0A0A9BTA7_ARUDO